MATPMASSPDSPFALTDAPCLGERVAATAFARAGLENRMLHSRGVARAAVALLEQHDSSAELVERMRLAGWVHDIGYAFPDTGMHSVDGAAWLRAQGVPELAAVAGDVGWHSTARWECEALGLGLPGEGEPDLYLHSVLWVADFTTSPRGEPVTVWERVGEIRDRYAPGSAVVRALEAALPSLHRALRMVRVGAIVD